MGLIPELFGERIELENGDHLDILANDSEPKRKALPPKDPGKPGFTGVDAHGHKWVNGRQVAIGDDEPAGQQPKATEQPAAQEQSPDAKAADYAKQLQEKFGDQAMERLEAMKQRYAGDEAKLNALEMVAAKLKPPRESNTHQIPIEQVDIGKLLGEPKNYGIVDQKLDAGEYTKERIPVSALRTDQTNVFDEKVQQFVDDPNKKSGGESEGDKFSDRIVVVKNGDKYHIADGNHRVAAAMIRGDKDIDAYVIEPKSESSNLEKLQDLHETAKTPQHDPQSVKDTIAAMSSSMSTTWFKDIAKQFGVSNTGNSKASIADAIARKINGRAEMLGRTKEHESIPSPLRKKP